jgi:manganese efflux pump family protein
VSLGATLKLAALVVPLGLDTLGVSVALGIGGLPAARRLRVALLFTTFEAAMPLVGVLLGAPLGHALGSAGDYVAAGLIVALGGYLLLSGDHDESERLMALTRTGAAGALALGLSISLDELAIGFSAGLLRLPIVPLAIAVALQAFVMAQVGLRLGARLATGAGERAERLAGAALVVLGVVLLLSSVR